MAIELWEVYRQMRQVDDAAQTVAQENIALKEENEKLKTRIKELEDGGRIPGKRVSK